MSTSVQAALLDVRVEAKHYAARTVLDHLSLRIAPGEAVSLVGPSGCGKSTLLRIVAGLDRQYQGEVRVNDVPQHGPSPQIGVIFSPRSRASAESAAISRPLAPVPRSSGGA